MFLPQTDDRPWLAIVATPTQLYLHMRAAATSFAELHVQLLLEGGY